MLACAIDSVNLVRFFLENGADANYYSSNRLFNSSPLSVSVQRNNYEITKLLLDYGADPNVWNEGLPLIFNVNNLQITKLLLEYGADPFVVVTVNDFYKYNHRKEQLDYITQFQNMMIMAVPNKNKEKYSKTPLYSLPADLHRELTYTLHGKGNNQFSKKKKKK
jgi:ankyrin repeat protein